MIELNENYWDCECEEDYIHEKAKKKYCVKCNTLHFNQPDSRQNEVDILLEQQQSIDMSDDKTYRIVSRTYERMAFFIVDDEGEAVSDPIETMEEALAELDEK